MRLFGRREKRGDSGTVELEKPLLSVLLGKGGSITKEQALQIPTVAACVNLIADRISALPIRLYRQDGKKAVEITEDRRIELLNRDTGDTVNAAGMKRLWVRDYFLGKGAYTYIERNIFGEITGLYYVDEGRVSIFPNNDPIRKSYAVRVGGRTYFPHEFLKILRNSKGLGAGESVIRENPLALSIYYNTMRFENATVRKGGNKRGFLKAGSTIGKKEMDALKEAWRELYSNSEDVADNIVVLNSGMEFQEASNTSIELQLDENKRTNAAELCKLFCMPSDILNGKSDDRTVSQFVQNCIMPVVSAIETSLDSDLLTEAEKAGHWYFAADVSELTRGDFLSRMNGYSIALQNNIYQLDEIRDKEDLPPLGFNYIRLSLADVLLDPKSGKIYTPNTDKMSLMESETGLTNGGGDDTMEARGNPYHDPTNGRFTSGGSGGGGLTDGMLTKETNDNATALENKRLLKEKIDSGEFPLTINPEKQARHILPPGASSMPDGRSFVTVDNATLQDIVNQYATTGDIKCSPTKNKFVEMVETDRTVGVDGYSNEKTKCAFIYYSKTGTHLAPTKKGRDNND